MKYSSLLACLAALFTGSAFADQVILTPSKDNTLYQVASGALSNGRGQGMFSGHTSGGSLRRALMTFDVAGNVPSGATITSAALTLTVTRARFGQARDMTLHKVTTDWGEGGSNAGTVRDGQGAAATIGDATWLHAFFPTSNWASAGGDFVATSSAVTAVSVPGGAFTWGSTAGMVADVQAWLDDASTNFGWLLKGVEATNQTSKRFGTREHPTATSRPRLTIEFDSATPALPSTWGAIKGLYR